MGWGVVGRGTPGDPRRVIVGPILAAIGSSILENRLALAFAVFAPFSTACRVHRRGGSSHLSSWQRCPADYKERTWQDRDQLALIT